MFQRRQPTRYMDIHPEKVFIQPLQHEAFQRAGIEADILRLDLIHPLVSGNKWFKLKYYLQEAAEQGQKEIVTAGGAYSNHIVAVAWACRESGLAGTGFIRGERPKAAQELSHTLRTAEECGMRLEFVDRERFRLKKFPERPGYFIEEGGYGLKGAEGAG